LWLSAWEDLAESSHAPSWYLKELWHKKNGFPQVGNRTVFGRKHGVKPGCGNLKTPNYQAISFPQILLEQDGKTVIKHNVIPK
jgi:hypothetical protein